MTNRRSITSRARRLGVMGLGEGVGRESRALEPRTAKKQARPAHWPAGVDSEIEMRLYTRLERAGIPLGEGQYRFVPGRQFRWDRCWPERMIAVECQGGVWVNGAHSRGSGVQRDCLKLSMAAALGWRCLPVTDEMIESGVAIDLLRQALGLDSLRVDVVK